MRFLKFALSAMLTLALAACAYPGAGGRGTGSVVVLDEADTSYMSQALQGALESNKSGQSANWINPETNHQGAVTPLRTFKSKTGQDCREFQRLATIAGKTGFAYGTACRQPDGTWRIVSSADARTGGGQSYTTTTAPYYVRGPRYGGYAGYGPGYGHYGYGYPYSYRYSYGYRHHRRYGYSGRHYGSRFSFGFGYH